MLLELASPLRWPARAAAPITIAMLIALAPAAARGQPQVAGDGGGAVTNPWVAMTEPPSELIRQFDEVVRIDMRGGAPDVNGSLRFPREKRVLVLFVNKNPFLFAYDNKVNAVGVPSQDAATAKSFLDGTGLFGKEKEKGDEAPKPTSMPGGGAIDPQGVVGLRPRNGAPICTSVDDEAERQRLDMTIREHRAEAEALIERIEKANALLLTLDEHHARLLPTLRNPSVEAGALYEAGIELRDAATAARREAWSVAKPPAAVATALRERASTALADAKRLADPQDGCARAASLVTRAVDALLVAEWIAPRAEEFGTRLRRLDEMNTTLSVILASPRYFWEDRRLGPYDSATVVTITMTRTNITLPKESQKADPFGEEQLRFGQPRALALALGPGLLGGFPRRTFARVQQVAPETDAGGGDGDGGEGEEGSELTTVAGVDRESHVRVPPMALLHLRLHSGPLGTSRRRWWESSLHLTLGTNFGTDILDGVREWLPGLSLGLRDERMFVTVGPFIGPKRSLNGGLRVGDPVPESLAELPTRVETKIGWGIALSYRVQ